MPQLDTLRLARDQKTHDSAVHQRYLVQVENEPRTVFSDLSPYLVEILRLEAPDEPERRRASVNRNVDSESHRGCQSKRQAVIN